MRLALVHLSDLHVTDQNNELNAKLESLVAAITAADPTCNDYIVILSGDIANSGEKQEYIRALDFLREVKRLIVERNPSADVHFVAVPGNHDCVLPKTELSLRSALVEGISRTLQTNAPDPAILESILNSQKHYFDFWALSENLTKCPIGGLFSTSTLLALSVVRSDPMAGLRFAERLAKTGDFSQAAPCFSCSRMGLGSC